MIKSILVAIDSSDSSKAALYVGAEIAKVSGAKLKGLYIEDITRLLDWQPVELIGAAITTSPNIPHGRPTQEQVEVEKEFLDEGNKLKELFNQAKEKFNIEGEFTIQRGKIDDLIIAFAKTVDLVVVGRRGTTYPQGAKEPGPTTESLLRKTTRPVIVVPPDAKLTSKMLIAYDGSTSAQRALAAGVELAVLFNAGVRVVNVGDDIDKAEKPLGEAKDFLSSHKLSATCIVGFGADKPWKAIMDQAKNHEAGVIVLGAFGDNKLLEAIFGSTAKEVLMQSKSPVLLAR